MPGHEVRSQEWIDKIEDGVRRVQALPDAAARDVAIELLQAVLDFHAAGLERAMEIVSDAPEGEAIIRRLAQDELTSSLLLLHDLHPDDLETRINAAVQNLHNNVFAPLGAKLVLESLDSSTLRLRFESARAWSGTPVRRSVENAIFSAAPEIDSIVIDGLKEAPAADFVPLSHLLVDSRV